MAIKVMKLSDNKQIETEQKVEIMSREVLTQLIKDKTNQYLKESGDHCALSELVHELRDEKEMELGMSNRNLWVAFIKLNEDTTRVFKVWDEKLVKYVMHICKR